MTLESRPKAFRLEDRLMLLALVIIPLPMLAFPLGLGRDYPNHLARIHIEALLSHSNYLSAAYRLDWGNTPDLAMDLIVPYFAPAIGTITSGSIFNALTVILLPLGAWALSRQLYGTATSLTLFSALAPFGAILAWGFMNYLFALGVALLLFVLWIRTELITTKIALFAIMNVLLYFLHVLGFLALGLMVFAWEAGCLLSRHGTPNWQILTVRRMALSGISFLPPILLMVDLFIHKEDLDARLPDIWGPLSSRVEAFTSIFNFYDAPAALILTALALGTLVHRLVKTPLKPNSLRPTMAETTIQQGEVIQCRGTEMAAGMFTVLAALALLTALTPVMFHGIWGLHLRYGPLFLAVFAATIPVGASVDSAKRYFILAVAVSCFFFQQSNVWSTMSENDRSQTELFSALNLLPKGSRLLAGRSKELETQDLIDVMHSQSLAVIARDAYVVNLFTNTSPVGVAPSLRALHQPQAWPLSEVELRKGLMETLGPAAVNPTETRYWSDWPNHFDFLLWFDSEDGENSPDFPFLQEVVRGEVFTLYRISQTDKVNKAP